MEYDFIKSKRIFHHLIVFLENRWGGGGGRSCGFVPWEAQTEVKLVEIEVISKPYLFFILLQNVKPCRGSFH